MSGILQTHLFTTFVLHRLQNLVVLTSAISTTGS